MLFELEELPPLQERKAIHSSHFIDNQADGDFSVLVGRKNTFLFEMRGKDRADGMTTAVVYRPFERTVEEPLEELVDFVGQECVLSLHLKYFPASVLNKYRFTLIPRGRVSRQIRLYQTPLKTEEYDAKLKRFSKSGFMYRELTADDMPLMVSLCYKWGKSKIDRLLSGSLEVSLESIRDISEGLGDLKRIVDEITGISSSISTPDEYQRLMSQPLTRFYGVFKDGELLAYIHTEGNDSFQVFHSRASVRVNTKSPQEFLDLSVAREFAQRGVKMFDRGALNTRPGIPNLTEYKKKFGEIRAVDEVSKNDIYFDKSPEAKYFRDKLRIEE